MIPKFRAWDKEDNVMREVAGIHCGIGAIEFFDEELDSGTYDLDKYDVMQCTGAKDMHGEDIYEGDVIRKEECSPDDMAFGHYGSTGTVKYNPELMAFVIDGDGVFSDACPMKYSFVSIEVIGNIYEDTELLEQ